MIRVALTIVRMIHTAAFKSFACWNKFRHPQRASLWQTSESLNHWATRRKRTKRMVISWEGVCCTKSQKTGEHLFSTSKDTSTGKSRSTILFQSPSRTCWNQHGRDQRGWRYLASWTYFESSRNQWGTLKDEFKSEAELEPFVSWIWFFIGFLCQLCFAIFEGDSRLSMCKQCQICSEPKPKEHIVSVYCRTSLPKA